MSTLKAYSIVLLPDAKTSIRLIGLSQDISHEKPCYFSLGDEVNIPHLSLYMLQLEDHDAPNVVSSLQRIADDTNALSLQALRFRTSCGYFEIEYTNTVEGRGLQVAVIDAANEYRVGILPSDEFIMAVASGDKLTNFESFGYAYVGKLFRPHITLTRFVNSNISDPENMPELKNYDSKFIGLALCKLGDNGTCSEIVCSIRLQ